MHVLVVFGPAVLSVLLLAAAIWKCRRVSSLEKQYADELAGGATTNREHELQTINGGMRTAKALLFLWPWPLAYTAVEALASGSQTLMVVNPGVGLAGWLIVVVGWISGRFKMSEIIHDKSLGAEVGITVSALGFLVGFSVFALIRILPDPAQREALFTAVSAMIPKAAER